MKSVFWLAVVLFLPAWPVCAASYESSSLLPPAPIQEFRGAWIAGVVTNPDWPSRPGLRVAEQKAELIALLDRAVQLRLNAVIFQVRPACDAVYASPIEPWTEYLTGSMGKAPGPFYDPLAFAVVEAHKRGLELHAWFNPFRALHPSAKSAVALNHISRTRPDLVRRYGTQIWLDPGEPDVRDHTLRVVMDVVRRYDIDGVQFDDYFYPYKEKDAAGRILNFPDDSSWNRHGVRGGLSRDDWRRENINGFVQRIYQSIKAAKPWVKFGISPFGIWRPGHPPQIKGLDAYADIYADARKWLVNGWVDYLAPQLYWAADQTEQSFPVLLDWWSRQNAKGRHLWPGLNAANVPEKWLPDEIVRQIELARRQAAGGVILFRLSMLTQNRALGDAVLAVYGQPALVPASPWLGPTPGKPVLNVATGGWPAAVKAAWQTSSNEIVRHWILQTRSAGAWEAEILEANKSSRTFSGPAPDAIAVSSVDRAGNVSLPAVVALKTPPERQPQPARPTPVKKRPLKKAVTPKNGGR